jgi:hypothetical protein
MRGKLKLIFWRTGISNDLWPTRSLDLTPSEFFLLGPMKGKVYMN